MPVLLATAPQGIDGMTRSSFKVWRYAILGCNDGLGTRAATRLEALHGAVFSRRTGVPWRPGPNPGGPAGRCSGRAGGSGAGPGGGILAGGLAALAAPGPLLSFGVFAGPTSGEPMPAGRAYAGPLTYDWDEARYAHAFDQVKTLIASGDIYQANLSLRARFAFAGDPKALYRRLQAQSAAAHCAYVDEGDRQILSLSPELFFDLS